MNRDASTSRANAHENLQIPPNRTLRLIAILLGAISAVALLSLLSFDVADLPVLSSEANSPTHNLIGFIGAWIALIARGGFGLASFALPVLCFLWAIKFWNGDFIEGRWITRNLSCLIFLASLGTIISLTSQDPSRQAQMGGAVGYLFVRWGGYYLGTVGTAIISLCVAGLSWFLLSDQMGMQLRIGQFFSWMSKTIQHLPWFRKSPSAEIGPGNASASSIKRTPTYPNETQEPNIKIKTHEPSVAERMTAKIRSTVVPRPKTLAANSVAPPRKTVTGFQLPSRDLLNNPAPLSERQLGEDLQTNARILIETLKDFGIDAKCVNIDRGPAVTRYEMQPAPGVKITKIVSLADDLALVMKAANCHVVAPIPGKGLVGIDVPNSTSTIVYLKEIISSREHQHLSSPIALAIGKDVSGHPVCADLRDCPHLLIAGATGSGKTVCLNSILTGILYQASPEDVKFLMIDPKMVELVLFNDLPHLVAPVVTDSKKAGAALHWAVQEMERRYQMLAKAGARNIDAYNQKIANGSGPAEQTRMPYLVVVIDELADLMMVSSQDVEDAITRLSQLSRAVGIHIILATQRPSVDVITGVIKANFPARIAFQVASKVDSRTILDVNGADKLLGRGDLLFLQPGTAKPIRAQGCFVTDEEIERITSFVKAQRQPSYDEQLIARQEKPAEAFMTDKDELYEMAKKLILETGQASTSLLQRRLRLGYARAARILDLMEQEGLVGPPQGSRPREILVDPSAVESS